MTERTEDDTPPERTLWQRIKDGAKAAIMVIPKALMWTAGIFTASYVAERATGLELIGVKNAVEGKNPVRDIVGKAAVPLAITMGVTAVSTCAGAPDHGLEHGMGHAISGHGIIGH